MMIHTRRYRTHRETHIYTKTCMHTYRIAVHKSKRELLYTLIHIRNNSFYSNGIHISEARGEGDTQEGDTQEGERANKARSPVPRGFLIRELSSYDRQCNIPRIRTSVGILIDKNST